MIIINIFGAPCSGKSTAAAGLFSMLKREGKSVEFVTEHAKDCVWDENWVMMNNQIKMFGEQYHRIWRLKDKVDFVVTDSPLLLNLVYGKGKMSDTMWVIFRQLVIAAVYEFGRFDFLLERDFPYVPEGRHKDENRSSFRHKQILEVLNGNDIRVDWKLIKADWYVAENIRKELDI